MGGVAVGCDRRLFGLLDEPPNWNPGGSEMVVVERFVVLVVAPSCDAVTTPLLADDDCALVAGRWPVRELGCFAMEVSTRGRPGNRC